MPDEVASASPSLVGNRLASADFRPAANLSLVFDKAEPTPNYTRSGRSSASAGKGKDPKEARRGGFIDALRSATVGASADGRTFGCLTASDARRLDRVSNRLRRLGAAIGGRCYEVTATAPFVTGIGMKANAFENGLVFHPVYGVPYWPGTSIKGALRNYGLSWSETVPEASDLATMFGEGGVAFGDLQEWIKKIDERDDLLAPTPPRPDADRTRKGQSGDLIVFDALPASTIALRFDVMTPHYASWYQASTGTLEQAVPADWSSPTPIRFLAVPAGTKFDVVLASRSRDVRVLDLAEDWLKGALRDIGGGAKTGAGYGRFDVVPIRETR